LHRTVQRRIVLILLAFVVLIILIASKLLAPYYWRLAYPFDYREEVLYYAGMYGVDPFLVAAVIKVESGFNPEARSLKGACGLMQIMPNTGMWAVQQMGLVGEFNEEMLFDPCFNIQVGTWYLAHLKEHFDGRRAVILAAYNGGKGRVEEWLDTGLWDGEMATIDSVPFPETRNFVRRVERIYSRYRWLYYQ